MRNGVGERSIEFDGFLVVHTVWIHILLPKGKVYMGAFHTK